MTAINANGIRLEYERFGDPAAPTLLLIIGLASQLIHWPVDLCRKIADRGFHVIRYDNRDAGLSTKIDELDMAETASRIESAFAGHNVAVPYTIEDMANDAAGLLDSLHIDTAHVCGMSMGGFIAQTLAVKYPSRTSSLTSVYSSYGNRKAFQPTPEAMQALLTPPPAQRDAYIDYLIDFYKLGYGTGCPFDEGFHRRLAATAFDRSFCPEGSARQYLAIMVQKDREEALRRLKIPALIVHGDEDPIVPLSAGEATANAIPNAELMVVEGMGHVMPNLNAYWDAISDAMIRHLTTAS